MVSGAWATTRVGVALLAVAAASAAALLGALVARSPGQAIFLAILVATAVAAAGSLWCARWAYRRWRAASRAAGAEGPGDPNGGGENVAAGLLAAAGLWLSLLSLVTVLFVGLPALVLPTC